MPSQRPSKKECKTAIKILKSYKRLAEVRGLNLSPERLEELNCLREAGTMTINDLPATLHREFPKGVFGTMTLGEIRELCDK